MKDKRGFTLTELLLVIVVIAIIIGIASFGTITAIKRAKAKQAKIHEDNLMESAVTYLYLAKRTCPNGYGDEAMNLTNCITMKCPSDFVVKKDGYYEVNSKYSVDTDPYDSCAIELTASDVMDGIGVNRSFSDGALHAGDTELLDSTKTSCQRDGKVLVYKDQYGSFEAISLTKDICFEP